MTGQCVLAEVASGKQASWGASLSSQKGTFPVGGGKEFQVRVAEVNEG